MTLADIMNLLTVLGGFEALKWGVNFIVNRRTNARKEGASAASLEHENEKQRTDWLETRLEQRDTRVDAQSVIIRKLEEEKLEILKEKHQVEMTLQAAEFRKCTVRGCENRKPPSDY